jgi:hypothetical protein
MAIRVLGAAWLAFCCFAQPPRQPWNYRLDANLDDANLRCTGTADLHSRSADASRQCIAWRILEQKCTGSKDADWLHEDDLSGEICRRSAEETWQVTKSLPGRAVCNPSVTLKDGRPAALTISCTWECRGPREACSGAATYRFSIPKK